jgi:hypothetical protein
MVAATRAAAMTVVAAATVVAAVVALTVAAPAVVVAVARAAVVVVVDMPLLRLRLVQVAAVLVVAALPRVAAAITTASLPCLALVMVVRWDLAVLRLPRSRIRTTRLADLVTFWPRTRRASARSLIRTSNQLDDNSKAQGQPSLGFFHFDRVDDCGEAVSGTASFSRGSARSSRYMI